MAQITVYSKPRCVQCAAVYRWLDKRELEYTVVNLEDHLDKLEEFRAMNLMQAPIVVVDDHEPFSGFRPDLLDEYVFGIVPTPAKLYNE